jgi:magnesium-transporting ATPase (P-type)
MSKNDQLKCELVVDGQLLERITSETELSFKFRDIAMKCDAVLACRLKPSQKAEVFCTNHSFYYAIEVLKTL